MKNKRIEGEDLICYYHKNGYIGELALLAFRYLKGKTDTQAEIEEFEGRNVINLYHKGINDTTHHTHNFKEFDNED